MKKSKNVGIGYEYAVLPEPPSEDRDAGELKQWALTEELAVQKAVLGITEDEDHTTTYVLRVIKIVRWPEVSEPEIEEVK